MADRRSRHRVAAFAAAALVFLLDQAAKWIMIHPLSLLAREQPIQLLPIFQLRFVPNYGVSMGFLMAEGPTERWLLVGMTAVIAIAVTYWMWRERNRQDALALGCVLGGALGNILDRVRFGYVVDFADLHIRDWHPFLVFNVADAAITVGVLLLLVRALFTREKPVRSEDRVDA